MKFSTVLLASSAILSGVSAGAIWTDYELHGICWRACFHEEPHCPHGWHKKHFGKHCWSCCKDQHDVAEYNPGEICWRPCIPDKPDCPHGWHAKQFDKHCWACCKEHDDEEDLDRWL